MKKFLGEAFVSEFLVAPANKMVRVPFASVDGDLRYGNFPVYHVSMTVQNPDDGLKVKVEGEISELTLNLLMDWKMLTI